MKITIGKSLGGYVVRRNKVIISWHKTKKEALEFAKKLKKPILKLVK